MTVQTSLFAGNEEMSSKKWAKLVIFVIGQKLAKKTIALQHCTDAVSHEQCLKIGFSINVTNEASWHKACFVSSPVYTS